jgi:hypothetical protein
VSSDRSPPPSPDDEGLGCRTLAVSAGVLIAFGVLATAAGLVLALADTSPLVQQIGFGLYGAGAPISGLFAAIAGELPLAPFTDLIAWLVLAVLATRVSEGKSIALFRVLGVILACACTLGIIVSFLIERT